MRYSRIQSYVQKYRKREYDFRTRESDFDILSDISALLPPDMSDMKTKLDGYQLTEMNFFELTTILENEFTKAFAELRLIDSKKIPNARFREIIAQYDNEILRMNGQWVKSDENIVFTRWLRLRLNGSIQSISFIPLQNAWKNLEYRSFQIRSRGWLHFAQIYIMYRRN